MGKRGKRGREERGDQVGKKKPLSILMVSRILDSKDPVGHYTERWAEALAGKVDRLYFICLEAYDVSVKAENFEYYSIGKERGLKGLRLLINYYRLLFTLMGKVDGFFGHMNSLYTVLAVPVAKVFGVKVVSWVTYIEVNFLIRLNTLLSDVMVTASTDSLKINTKKKVALGHGIDLDLFKRDKVEKRKREMVSLGRISRIKDYGTIIEACAGISEKMRREGWSYKIYGATLNPGNRQYARELRELIGERSIEDIVEINDPVPYEEVVKVLNRSSIFVHAQPFTAIDKAPLESMATETITVMYNPAYKELMGGELSGLLLFRKGDPRDLAKKIEKVMEMDEVEREDIGRRLREIVVKNHNLDLLMERLVSIFRD